MVRQAMRWRRLPGHQTYLRMAFSPDGSKLAVGGAEAFTTGKIKVWDVATRKELLRWPGRFDIVFGGLAFSPDGKRLASAGGTLKLWDMATGLEVMGFPNAGRSVAFSPDGNMLAGGATGPDGVAQAQVLLWRTR